MKWKKLALMIRIQDNSQDPRMRLSWAKYCSQRHKHQLSPCSISPSPNLHMCFVLIFPFAHQLPLLFWPMKQNTLAPQSILAYMLQLQPLSNPTSLGSTLVDRLKSGVQPRGRDANPRGVCLARQSLTAEQHCLITWCETHMWATCPLISSRRSKGVQRNRWD